MSEARCPWCNTGLTFIGSIGIEDSDGRWDMECDRYRCETDHMIFVGHADVADMGEEDGA